MTDDDAPATRAQRRARTHAAILRAAQQTFAENGYEKATIRAVAERAGYHPALVMQHFGTKNALFRAATAIDLDVRQALPGPEETRGERVLRHTFSRLDAQRDSAASTLRSMLTHDQFADEALELFNPPGPEVGESGDDAELRRELITALVLGTAITRYVLTTPAVQDASLDRLLATLLPAAEALNHSPPARPARTPARVPADAQQRDATTARLTAQRDAGTLTAAQLRAAAAEHGVSERTVRRWLASASNARTPRTDRYTPSATDRAALAHYRGNATAAWRARNSAIAGRGEAGHVPSSLADGWAHARPVALRTWQRALVGLRDGESGTEAHR